MFLSSGGKNNKLMSLCIDDERLLEKHKTILTKIEDLKNIELNTLPPFDYRYMKIKIGTYGDGAYKVFRGLNLPENGVKCESFTVIFIDFLLV